MGLIFSGLALLGGAAGWVLSSPIPLMFSVLLAVAGLAERQARDNLLAALRAHHAGPGQPGSVIISACAGDMEPRWQACASVSGQTEWSFEFIPQDWQPQCGVFPADIWVDPRLGAPVLVCVATGILIPRRRPQRRAFQQVA